MAMPAVGCAASALRERQSRGSTHFPNLFWPSLLVGVNRCSPSRVRLGNAPHIIPGCGVSKRARKRLFSLKTGGGGLGVVAYALLSYTIKIGMDVVKTDVV